MRLRAAMAYEGWHNRRIAERRFLSLARCRSRIVAALVARHEPWEMLCEGTWGWESCSARVLALVVCVAPARAKSVA